MTLEEYALALRAQAEREAAGYITSAGKNYAMPATDIAYFEGMIRALDLVKGFMELTDQWNI